MNNKNNTKTLIIITYVVALLMFGLDQYTKQMVIQHLPIIVDVDGQKITQYAESYKLVSWLWLTHVVNFGAAFSILYGKKYILLFMASLISAGVIYFEVTSRAYRTKVLSSALGFIMAGAAGNVFDRVRLGYVTDFFDFRNSAGQNVWPIWNVADMSIDIGIVLLIIYFFFQENKNKKTTATEDQEVSSQ